MLPDDLKDDKPLRFAFISWFLFNFPNLLRHASSDISRSTEELENVGWNDFNRMYGDTAESVQGLLDESYPDLGKPSSDQHH